MKTQKIRIHKRDWEELKKEKKEIKDLPSIDGERIQKTWSDATIARAIERYLNECGMLLTEENALKLASFGKTSFEDIIITLYKPGTQQDVIKYFKKYWKVEVSIFKVK
jgi:hypothetical protein